jgi:plastocyanin
MRTTLLGAVALILVGCGGGATPAAAPGTPAVPVEGRLTVVAQGIALTPAQITMTPALLTIDFDNRDAGVPHDLALYAGSDVKLAATEIISGPATATLSVPMLVPGTYRLTCSVHPNMVASLTVAPGP